MKVELHLNCPPGVIERQAEAAEATGADAIVATETGQDALLPLALAAGVTRRVKLATGIVVAFPRSPMVTAMQSWYLHECSEGRFELGLGSQVKGRLQGLYSTAWTAPGPRMREYVESLRTIWESWQSRTPLHYIGSHYSFTLGTGPGLRPLPYGDIPISIAAVNPYMLRLAAEIGDGVRLHSFCSSRYLKQVVKPEIETGMRKSGRKLSNIDISGGGMIVTGRDRAEVNAGLEQARRSISFYGSTRSYGGSFALYGWQQLTETLHEMSLNGAWDEMVAQIPDEVVAEFVVAGEYDELPDLIQERFGGFVNRLSLSLPLETNSDVDAARRLISRIQAA